VPGEVVTALARFRPDGSLRPLDGSLAQTQ